MLKITKAKYLKEYTLILWFNDETIRVVDFESLLDGDIYAPLKDVSFFRRFKIDCGTVSWKNGADFAPEFLRKKGKLFKQAVAARYEIVLAVPEICKFDGIKIYINYNDHNPPHFHAAYEAQEAIIDIKKCKISEGKLPDKKLKSVLTWAKNNMQKLLENWKLAVEKKPLERIPPPAKKRKKSPK